MTTEQKKRVLKRITEIDSEISNLKHVRQEICSSGYASATMSSGGGSKSYTRMDIGKINEALKSLMKEMRELRQLLSGHSSLEPKQVITVYL